ncbi:MAG: hypothetical protein K6U00_01800 [Armatimonadetes bacterium]|nr:hypothetical protein [Armatimonadota bacterium]
MMARRMFIGYWGCPSRQVISKVARTYPYDEFIDLDVNMNAPSSGLVPDAYCQIVTNIVDNALHLRQNIRLIIASVGEDKCDGGRFAALILKDLGFPIMEVRNTESEREPLTISTSGLPLLEKVNRIMDGVVSPNQKRYPEVQPTHGFWGVPPHDMRLLELFPNTTHVYGWTRCVEAGVPADLELEMYVDPGVPTVFYTQTFCQKTVLAKYLAEKYDGLYIDCDGSLTNSVIAKVTAFIRMG